MSTTKKMKKENTTIHTKKRKTNCCLEDTPWVAFQEDLNLTSRHDA